MNTCKWLLAAAMGLAWVAVRPSTVLAQEWSYPGHLYYVTYWCPEWRETPPMSSFEAQELVNRLQGLGGEVRLVGRGAAVDDPAYPAMSFRMVAVRYRLLTPAQRATPDPLEARDWQDEVQGLGFKAYLTVDKPYAGGPRPVPPASPPPSPGASPAGELQTRSVWTGTTRQEDRLLPTRLVLDRHGQEVSGELSFSSNGQNYRARVRGSIDGDTLSFTTYEALEGRVYVPCVYRARLKGTTMHGTWEYPPEHLEDDFELKLTGS